MAEGSAAKRYARAAFELAVEAGEEEAWAEALRRMVAFFARDDVSVLLENPRMSVARKLQLVEAGLGDLPSLPLNLARLLVAQGRVKLAARVAEQLTLLLEERRGIVRARATTAVPMAEAVRASLAGRLRELTGRTVEMETEVDPSILGGIVVQIGDRLIDGSARARLRALKESLVGAR
jgi:F-type H+-transporting ATPase subunit delta